MHLLDRLTDWWQSTSGPSEVQVDHDSYWSKGAEQGSVLVEAGPAPKTRSKMTEVLNPSQDGGRPRGNPIFTETLFVELLRAGQFSRAYDLLAPVCQVAWKGKAGFADTMVSTPYTLIQKVSVKSSKVVEEWFDGEVTWKPAAQLEVEYLLQSGRQSKVIKKSVHLVSAEGKWRILLFPDK
jgi:hypothetical protein